MQQGTTCSREVASLPKTSSCKEKSDSVSSNLSSCSVSDLAQLTNQYRATGRIRRESRGQLGGGLGQSSVQVLTNSLKKKLNKLDLIPPENSRDSVISYTPSRQPPTSTPSNIFDDIGTLSEKVSKVEDWKVETDLSVSKAVRSITSWKKELESLTTLYREFSELVSHHDITEDEVEIRSTEMIFNKLKIDVKECIDLVEKEDVKDDPEYKGSTVDSEDSLEYETDKFEVNRQCIMDYVVQYKDKVTTQSTQENEEQDASNDTLREQNAKRTDEDFSKFEESWDTKELLVEDSSPIHSEGLEIICEPKSLK